jgi:two-component system chemotaxis sensor kinase CheA
VFRGLHTLKGSGAMFGFEALAGFTHHCETAFDRAQGQGQASQALIGVVLSARDHMQALIDVGTRGRSDAGTAGDAILAALEKAVAGRRIAIPAQEAERKGWRMTFKLPPGSMANGTNPLPLLDELRELGDCRITPRLDELPPLASMVPTECYIYWDVELVEGGREDIEDVFIFVIDDMDLAITPLVDEPDRRSPVGGVPVATVVTAPQPTASKARQVRGGRKAYALPPKGWTN